MTFKKYFLAIFIFGALGANAFAEVRLPKIFGSNMVLQQEKPIAVWGWDAPGTKVSVSFNDKTVEATANDKGEWSVKLPAMKADGKPHSLIVKGSTTRQFDNILLGEVWLGSGQSNMEMGIKNCNDADAEVAAANWPMIRLFMIPKKYLAGPTNDVDAVWKVCSPQTVAEGGWNGFSAAAYYFGRTIHTNLGVPVGLIQSAWGGTRIEPWTAPEGFAQVPVLQTILTQAQAMNPRSALRKEYLENYLRKTESWIADARQSIASETPSAPMPGFPPELLPPQNQQAPSVLYNAMIYGLVPFTMRGALWYQGEANSSEGKLYTEKMKALILGWRKLWDDNFPFYFVQIAPWPYGGSAPNVLPEFWEAQDLTTRVVPNTGMVVIQDVGDIKDIHPKNKQEVGKRLALQAMANTYGRRNVVFSGPAFKSMTVEGENAKLSFDHVGSGLASRDGKALTLFEIIDASEGGWVNADAAIQGNTVVLSSPKVKKPLGVRFAWTKLAEPNFMNKEGLPGVPFRAGDISSRDALSMNVDEVRDYQLALELDLSKIGGETVTYQVDNRAKLARPFDRIAYYLELKDAGGAVQWLYVSMDAFTDDLSKIGVPTLDSKAKFQQLLTGLTVFSGVPGIAQGTGLKGNIEFWPNNYAAANAKNIPNASASGLDFGDQISDPENGYGSMQIHNYDARQTLFAINNWKAGANADLGIGNRPGDINTDWTFSATSKNYTSKKLKVFVRLK